MRRNLLPSHKHMEEYITALEEGATHIHVSVLVPEQIESFNEALEGSKCVFLQFMEVEFLPGDVHDICLALPKSTRQLEFIGCEFPSYGFTMNLVKSHVRSLVITDGISDLDAVNILRVNKLSTHLEIIKLFGEELTDIFLANIKEDLPKTITSVFFGGLLTDECVEELIPMLPRMVSFGIMGSGITNSGFMRMIYMIPLMPKLEYLSLFGNMLNDYGIAELIHKLQGFKLKGLALGSSGITDISASSLSNALMKHSIRSLLLLRSSITDVGVEQLLRTMPQTRQSQCTVTTADFDQYQLSFFARKMMEEKYVSSLFLVSLNAVHIPVLIEILPETAIQRLEFLYHDQVNLGPLIAKLPGSKVDELVIDTFNDAVVMQLCEHLPNTNIQSLILSRGEITDDTVAKLAETLPSTKLIKLCIKIAINLDPDAIIKCLPKTQIEFLFLDDDNRDVVDDAMRSLALMRVVNQARVVGRLAMCASVRHLPNDLLREMYGMFVDGWEEKRRKCTVLKTLM